MFKKHQAANKVNRVSNNEGLGPSSCIGSSRSFVGYKRKKSRIETETAARSSSSRTE
ncbi:hypothetical protein Dimus_015904, partial [Dionaea muscipula]